MTTNDLGILKIDHITMNVNSLSDTVDFFKTTMGFGEYAYFAPHTNISGMTSKVVNLGDIKFAINQGTNEDSQISEFVKQHGEGVQHIAFLVEDLAVTVAKLKERGMPFLTEILDDADDQGTLRQIFTKPLFGGMFFEFIQRNGCMGFGTGNVQKLYDGVEDYQRAGGAL